MDFVSGQDMLILIYIHISIYICIYIYPYIATWKICHQIHTQMGTDRCLLCTDVCVLYRR